MTYSYTHKKVKAGFITQLYLNGVEIGQYALTKKGNDYRNAAEIYPEYRGQGHADYLLLAAIKSAEELGIDFHEDTTSQTKSMSKIYDNLYDANYITGQNGFWWLTPEGEEELTSLNESSQPPITKEQLATLERVIDQVFGRLGIDIEFTRHFLDRVNDERNGRQITIQELGHLFAKEYKRWGNTIKHMPVDAQAVMHDLSSAINVPFVINPDSKNPKQKDLVAKTVMRKKEFKTPDRKLPVESVSEEAINASWEAYRELDEKILDPREAILRKALQFLDQKLNGPHNKLTTLDTMAQEVTREVNLNGIASSRDLAALYRQWRGDSVVTEGKIDSNRYYLGQSVDK
jgi:hypothetical protein